MTQKLRFAKYHGLGNDFILIDGISQRVDLKIMRNLAEKFCHRRFGIGADGLIIALPSKDCDCRMVILNSDGSEPEMCGNGIRCLAKFAVDEGLIAKDAFSVETLAGPMIPTLIKDQDKVIAVEVDMGEPILERAKIPVAGGKKGQVIREPLQVAGKTYEFTAVSMGNPHAVIFMDDIDALNLPEIGPQFETHPLFPQKTNTEFVKIISPKEAVMRVWERGAGETLACGTGACAILVAGVLTGKLERKAVIHLPGGPLEIEWQEGDNHVIMTGPAEHVFSGESHLNLTLTPHSLNHPQL